MRQSDDTVNASERRRRAAWQHGLSGLDAVDVSDDGRSVLLTLIGRHRHGLRRENVLITGTPGARPVNVKRVRRVRGDDEESEQRFEVSVEQPGDASRYTLRLVKARHGEQEREPLDGDDGFDPRCSACDFYFSERALREFDCADEPPSQPSAPRAQVVIDYLAKDYESFRSVMFDRLALNVPDWRERHVPDLGVALVELLAYVGDYLSYYQDAVATEAYLDTSRQRISVRRHVRLLGYQMHDGCNARAWVCVEATEPVTLDAGSFYFVTWAGGEETTIREDALTSAASAYEVFEPVTGSSVELLPAYNLMRLWTWGEEDYELPPGATRAALVDAADPESLQLRPGAVLMFEEVKGPDTGTPGDADPTHRQAVRLTAAHRGWDPVFRQRILEVEWATVDALEFTLPVSRAQPNGPPLADISIARGNTLLVDHGRTLSETLTVLDEERNPSGPGTTAVRATAELSARPVVHQTPYPALSRLGHAQAERIARIPGDVRRHIVALAHGCRRGRALTESDLDGLRVVFGAGALREAGLHPHGGGGRRHLAEDEARALRRLLAQESVLTRHKRLRIDVLAEHAQAGYLLAAREAAELRAAWGEAFLGLDELDPANQALFGPASFGADQDARHAMPAVTLSLSPPSAGSAADGAWTPQLDLLASGPDDRHFVCEIDDQDQAHLRFGDGIAGAAPEAGASFAASYRVGEPTAGNVGAEAISKIVFRGAPPTAIAAVRNPLPASGGTVKEATDDVRRLAPAAAASSVARAVTTADYAQVAEGVNGVLRAAAVRRWTGSWFEVTVAIEPSDGRDPSPHLLASVRSSLARAHLSGEDVRVRGASYVPLAIVLGIAVQAGYRRADVSQALQDAFSDRRLGDGTWGLFALHNLGFGQAVRASTLLAAAQAVPGVERTTVLRLGRMHAAAARTGVLRLRPFEVARVASDPRRHEDGFVRFHLEGGL